MFPLVGSEHGLLDALQPPRGCTATSFLAYFASQGAHECLAASVPAKAQNQTSICGLGRIAFTED